MHFFLSCISSQGSTFCCLAAVLYLFHIFHMVSSRFLLQSQHCTVFRVRLHVLLSHNSLSKYLVKGTGFPLSLFFICTEIGNNLQTEKGMEVMGCKQIWSSKGPGKLFSLDISCRGRHRKRTRKENTSSRSLSLLRPYTFSCPSNCS